MITEERKQELLEASAHLLSSNEAFLDPKNSEIFETLTDEERDFLGMEAKSAVAEIDRRVEQKYGGLK